MRRQPAISLTLAVWLTGCDSGPDPKSTRIYDQITPPGGQVEAVNAEDIGGMVTVTPSESVYLVSPVIIRASPIGSFHAQGMRPYSLAGHAHIVDQL